MKIKWFGIEIQSKWVNVKLVCYANIVVIVWVKIELSVYDMYIAYVI